MAKKNYTNKPIEEPEVVMEAPVVEEPVIEEVPEVVAPADPEKKADEYLGRIKVGVVNAPSKLNVRVAPKADAKIITVLAKDTKVSVNKNGGTKEWYKIVTENGLEGYCMKQFITIES